jgi:hypothetical protein
MRETLLPPERGADHPSACAVVTDNASDVPPGSGRPDDRVIVFLDGELDAATAPGLAEQLAPLAETGSHPILDLAGLRFCHCAGLSLFPRLRQRRSQPGSPCSPDPVTEPHRATSRPTGRRTALRGSCPCSWPRCQPVCTELTLYGDRRSLKPFGPYNARYAGDHRQFFDLICGDDHPCNTRCAPWWLGCRAVGQCRLRSSSIRGDGCTDQLLADERTTAAVTPYSAVQRQAVC